MRLISLIVLLCLVGQVQAQGTWNVNKPNLPLKPYAFNVNEGTWMNVDVHPDGTEIVFDLLGDIYVMPISGGEAKCIRKGMAMELQPRYSPNGQQILFTSDAGGGDNIWVMDRDGKNARQITKENFRLLNNGVWCPDGEYIIARKHFTSTRSLGAGEMWMYHISGGDGIQLTARKNDQQDVNEPSCSADGKYVYFSEDMYPGGYFQYNKDPNNQIFVIKRFNREKGNVEPVTGGPGSAFRPQISHDGKTLAFVKRVRTKTVLYLRNMTTGEEWPVYDGLSKDQVEAWTTFGVYTGFAWMPKDEAIVIWSGGKILKVDVQGFNRVSDIPFTAAVSGQMAETVRFKQKVFQDVFNPKVIRGARTSPDGKWLVFNAVGYLWKKALPNGTPVRLSTTPDFEFEPNFSSDGKQLVYVTWNDSSLGRVQIMNFPEGTGVRNLTVQKGMYRSPAFSPNNQQVVYVKEEGNTAMGVSHGVESGLYIVSVNGGEPEFVIESGEMPVFSKDGKSIYYQDGNKLKRCLTNGFNEQVVFKSTYGSQFTLSPDEHYVAFVDLHKVYVAPIPAIGKAMDISANAQSVPVKKVAEDAGLNLHWSADNKTLYYTLGDLYYSASMASRYAMNDSLFFAKMPSPINIDLQLTADKPEGRIAFTHARVITMEADSVLEDATVLVNGNKIEAVGPSASIKIGDAQIIDCTGKTLMPGFIDAHAHANHFRYGLTPQKHWPYYVSLAYGVTTLHDPSANSEMVFAQSELVKSGLMVGPRVFSTGTILYGAEGDFKAVINNLNDAYSAIRRTKAYGAFSVKSYNQPRREQNQMILKAARDLNIEVVPEGGSFFYHNMAMMIDGHTTIEHNLPIAPLYKDVVSLWKLSGTAITPTLVVSYGSLSGEYYWYQHSDVWKKERLLRFTPRAIIDTRSRHRTMAPEEEYENGHILVSQSLKKLNDHGVLINMGAHGQIQGIGAHWEIWMMKQGGMSNMQALKTATINPALSLGLNESLGSVRAGKLADLIVLDKNPLDDIYHTESIRWVMANGRLYDAETMDEIGLTPKKRGPFYWELNKASEAFPYHEHGIGEHHIDD